MLSATTMFIVHDKVMSMVTTLSKSGLTSKCFTIISYNGEGNVTVKWRDRSGEVDTCKKKTISGFCLYTCKIAIAIVGLPLFTSEASLSINTEGREVTRTQPLSNCRDTPGSTVQVA